MTLHARSTGYRRYRPLGGDLTKGMVAIIRHIDVTNTIDSHSVWIQKARCRYGTVCAPRAPAGIAREQLQYSLRPNFAAVAIDIAASAGRRRGRRQRSCNQLPKAFRGEKRALSR